MKTTEINKIKLKLNNEIEITNQKIKNYTELCKPIPPENAIGRVSRMDAINNKSVVEAALREAKQKMEQLQIMKNKIGHEDFGKCIKCKQIIPFGRLIIRPQSKFCIHCAQ